MKMTLMKKLFTFLMLASVVLVNAQDKNPTANDPAAKKILDAVSAKFKTYKSPQASFSYKVENAQGKALSTKKGTVLMKGNKYKVLMDGMEIYSDGRTTWNYDKAANEVTVNSVDGSGSAMTPQKLLTNFYDKDFYYKYNGEKKVGGTTVQEIELTPTDKSKTFHKVYLLVNKATSTISSARFLEKTGSRYVYSITSLKGSAASKDSDFAFDKGKHPGVEVVDLR
jgi:outer membrane lipoprotein-sorting protein